MIWVGCEMPGDNFISRAIASQDEPRRYSHAAMIFDGGLVCEAHADFGVRFREYTPDMNRWTLWPLDLAGEQYNAIERFLALHAGDGYDLCGVAAFKTSLIRQDPNKWFCSELVVAAMQTAGLLADAIASKVSPNGLSVLMDALANKEGR